MAIDVSVGDVLQVNLLFGLVDREEIAMNVLHYQVKSIMDGPLPAPTALPVSTVLPAMNAAMFASISTVWADLASNQVEMNGIKSQSIYPAPKSAPFTYTPTAVPGTIVSEALPLQDTPTILKRTIYGTKWGLGRVFVVGLPESGQAEGQMTNAQEVLVADLAFELKQQVTFVAGAYTYTLQPVLWSLNSSGHRITEIVDMVLSDDVIKTQRRRRPGKGT